MKRKRKDLKRQEAGATGGGREEEGGRKKVERWGRERLGSRGEIGSDRKIERERN